MGMVTSPAEPCGQGEGGSIGDGDSNTANEAKKAEGFHGSCFEDFTETHDEAAFKRIEGRGDSDNPVDSLNKASHGRLTACLQGRRASPKRADKKVASVIFVLSERAVEVPTPSATMSRSSTDGRAASSHRMPSMYRVRMNITVH